MAGLTAAETGASAATVGFGSALSAAGAAAKSFFVALATNPITWIAASMAVAVVAIAKVTSAFKDSVSAASDAKSEYQSATSELSSAQSELDSAQSQLSELKQKMTSVGGFDKLSLVDQAEFQQLRRTTSELEKQVKYKKQLAQIKASTAAETAVSALETKGAKTLSDRGNLSTFSSGQGSGMGNADRASTSKTVIQSVQQDLSKLKELQQKQQDAYKNLDSAQEGFFGKDKYKRLIDTYGKDIDEYKNNLSENVAVIQEQYDTLFSAYQKSALNKEQIASMREAKQILSDYSSLDMTGTEKSLNNLNTFFSSDMGHSGIEDYLTRVAKSGGDVNEALARLGLTAKDLGTNSKDLRTYFNDIAKAAEDASSSVQKVDGSFSGIASAFESQNGGDNLDSFLDFLSQANQLKKAGKTGTDDFQSVSTFMSGSTDIKSSLKNYQKNVDYLEKYLSKDKEGAYSTTESGMKQWAKDITEVGNNALASGKQIKTTDDLARELGTSAGVLELALSAFQDYDISTPFDNLPRAAENLEKAKAELTSLQELYDSMDAGDTKKKLGESIDSFQAQIDAANGDLSKLDKDIVLNMKLTYDLAEIQAQIDNVQEIVKNSADDQSKSENYAEMIALQEQKNKILMTGMNLTEKAVIEISPAFKVTDDAIGSLQKMLEKGVDKDGKELTLEKKVKIQGEISNLEDMQSVLLEKFHKTHPEITAETDTSEAEATFNEWVNSEEGKSLKVVCDYVVGLQDNPDAMEAAVNYVKDYQEDPDMMNALMNYIKAHQDDPDAVNAWIDYVKQSQENPETKDALMNYIKQYQDDPEMQEAMMNYVLQHQDDPNAVNAWLSYIKQHQDDPDGRTTWLTYLKNGQEPPAPKSTNVNYNKGSQASPSSKDANVNYKKGSQEKPSNLFAKVFYTLTGGNKANGTAHFNGTARSQQNSHFNGTAKASGDWSLKKDQTSLINELGPEIVVRDGKWHTFNNGYPTFAKLRRGDIVFNHKQTEELLKRGYVTNSHARVYGTNANGSPTALASGTAFADGSNKNTIDWIEVILKRFSTALEKFTTSAENAYHQLDERSDSYSQAIVQAQKNLSGQRSAYNAYMKAANETKLSENLKARVRTGGYYVYDGYSDDEQKLIEQYKKYWEAAQDVAANIVELDQKIAKLYTDQFSAIEKHFDNEMSMLEDYQSGYENKVSIVEARGHFVSSAHYEDQLAMQQRIRDKYALEMNELQEQLDKAVSSGAVKEWSDEWWSMRLKIEDCALGIQKVDKSVADLDQTMRELDWDKFDWKEDRISQITQESDFLMDLLENKNTVNDDGSFTAEGNALAGLHAANYAIYASQARDYAEEMKKIDTELAKDPSNQNLIERREKLLELQQKSIKSAKDEKDAIGGLIKDGIEKQKDAFKDLINSYQDALDSAQDLYDYQKKIASATEKVSNLEKQLNAYSGDDSEETRAAIQKLQKELKEAQEDLQETEYDQYISDLKKLTDQLESDYENLLNTRLDDLQTTVEEFIKSANINSSDIMQTLNDVSNNVGYTISDTLTKSFSESTSTISDLITNVDSSIAVLIAQIDKLIEHSDDYKSASNKFKNIKKVEYPSSNTISGSGSKSKNYAVEGYSDGGFIAGLKRITFDNGDDMITVNTLKKGEAVLTPEQTRILTKIASVSSNLYDAALTASTIPSLTKMLTAQPSSNLTSVEVPNINVTFSLPNVTNYQEFMNQMQKDKQYERMMKDMVLGCISGKNSLSKNNYHWK